MYRSIFISSGASHARRLHKTKQKIGKKEIASLYIHLLKPKVRVTSLQAAFFLFLLQFSKISQVSQKIYINFLKNVIPFPREKFQKCLNFHKNCLKQILNNFHISTSNDHPHYVKNYLQEFEICYLKSSIKLTCYQRNCTFSDQEN